MFMNYQEQAQREAWKRLPRSFLC